MFAIKKCVVCHKYIWFWQSYTINLNLPIWIDINRVKPNDLMKTFNKYGENKKYWHKKCRVREILK